LLIFARIFSLALMHNYKPLESLTVRALISDGVERLENRLGEPLEDMTRAVVLNIISTVISGVSSGPP
jgi:hypothetical protein